MAQNVYDDEQFLAGYSEFPRSRDGLDATSEWPAFRAMLPPIRGKRVVELGCAFGHLTRWLADEGATSVLGLDLSERTLARAVAETKSSVVTYQRADLDELTLPGQSAELIASSMTLHYVANFERIGRVMYEALVPGGSLVFSVEHPIYAARAQPEWVAAADGRQAFAIADYGIEGQRVTRWIVDGVIKYHRTIATMLNTLHGIGFAYVSVDEWKPSKEQLAAHPEWRNTELTRPMFLLVALIKPVHRAGPSGSATQEPRLGHD